MLYLVLFLIFISSIIAIFARVDERKDNARIEKSDLTANDFEILE